jgi:flagellar assembly factor FliW
MANLKDVPVHELLNELLSRVEAEMIHLQANIEAQEHEKKAVLHELDEVLRRLASSTKELGTIVGGRAKTSKGTSH